MENNIEKSKLYTNAIAINIVNDIGMIFNKKWVPILFIWDQKSNIAESFNKDMQFRNYIVSLLESNTSYYFDLSLYYYIYELVNGEEKYTDAMVEINKVWSVKDLSELGYDSKNIPLSLLFIDDAINHILGDINSDIRIHTEESSLDAIFDGIDVIRSYYGTAKLTDDSLTYAVRSYLQQLSKYRKEEHSILRRDDLNFIMDTFKDILTKYNNKQLINK